MTVYRKYSESLKEIYGDKVYKIPINLPVTCPNRDGNVATGGCIYCGEVGTGYEMRSATESINTQIEENIERIKKRYKAKYFIPYLQNFSNTYLPISQFKKVLGQLNHSEFVELAVSTRPDCISTPYLEALKEWQQDQDKEVCIELGLQTINYHSLKKINRGHTLAEYLDAIMQIKAYNFKVCTHIILDLPWDNVMDVIETAKCISAMRSTYVKLHALYVVKNTPLAKAYEQGTLEMVSMADYKKRVILFLRYLSPDVIVQRIIGRAPEEHTLYANWNTSWWKIHDEIVAEMEEKGYQQGDLCDYLGGRAVRKFEKE